MIAFMFLFGLALRVIDDARELLGGERGGLLGLILFVPIVKQELDVASLLAAIPVLLVTFFISEIALLRREGVSSTP